MTAAAARAAHLIVDAEPVIFADTLAQRLLGADAEALIAYHRRHGDHPILAGARAQAVLRSRVAEDVLAGSDATQYVLLGAGLDSFAYRDARVGLRVFEVDHSASQADKLARLAAAGLGSPATVAHVPLDLGGSEPPGTIVAALRGAGFDDTLPAVVSWLGVTMYLDPAAVEATLVELGGALARGSAVVFDYMLAERLRDEAGRTYADQVSAVAAERGEPWRATFTPGQVSALLGRCGFADVRQLDQTAAAPPGAWARTDALRPARLAMIAHAVRR